MNYKAGAQAGASRCQRHHPARTFRLVRFILGLMMKMSQAIVNLAGLLFLPFMLLYAVIRSSLPPPRPRFRSRRQRCRK
jgi:hypothetical protein